MKTDTNKPSTKNNLRERLSAGISISNKAITLSHNIPSNDGLSDNHSIKGGVICHPNSSSAKMSQSPLVNSDSLAGAVGLQTGHMKRHKPKPINELIDEFESERPCL